MTAWLWMYSKAFENGMLTIVEAQRQDHLELQNVTQIKRRRKCWKKISKDCDVLNFREERWDCAQEIGFTLTFISSGKTLNNLLWKRSSAVYENESIAFQYHTKNKRCFLKILKVRVVHTVDVKHGLCEFVKVGFCLGQWSCKRPAERSSAAL